MQKIKSLNLIRSIASLPIFVVLLLILIAGSVSAVTLNLVSNSSNTKDWIEKTGLYDDAPDLMVDFAFSKINSISNELEISGNRDPLRGLLSQDELREKIRVAFPPEWIKETVEEVIDSTYSALNNPGSIEGISIDLSDREETIREVLADVFKAKVSTLVPCAKDIEGTVEEFDLINAECLPQNIQKEDLFIKIDTEIGTLNVLSQNNIDKIEINGVENIEKPLSLNRFSSILPITLSVFIIIALILHIVLYLLFPGKKGKLVVFSALWGTTGALLLLIGFCLLLLFSVLYDSYIFSLIPAEASLAEPFIEKILFSIRSEIGERLIIIGLVFGILSSFTMYRLTKHGSKDII